MRIGRGRRRLPGTLDNVTLAAGVLPAAAETGVFRTTTMHWLHLAIAIVAEVLATSFLKASANFTKPLPSLVVVAGYGCAFYFLSLTLDRIPAGVAYAVWSGVGVTLIAAIGWAFLGQRLDAAAVAGMALIVAGVIVINAFSRVAAH